MHDRTVLRPRLARLDGLGLSSTEAFVFSQIDGASALGDVADLTGVPLDMVITIARRLAELGAVDAAGEARRSVAAKGAPPNAPSMSAERLLRVPRRTATDIYAMKIDPADAFLLSYVDGQLSIAEVAEILGYEPAMAIRSVNALVAAGALALGPPPLRAGSAAGGRSRDAKGEPARGPSAKASIRAPKISMRPPKTSMRPPKASLRPPKASLRPPKASLRPPKASLRPPKASLRPPKTSMRPPKASVRPSKAPKKGSARPTGREVTATSPKSTAAVTAGVDPTCDLDAENLAKIDLALLGAAGQTHYAILGVPRTASTKEIRRAYFARAATLHPDRYFGKKLGPYKKRLDEAFQRVTDSYELLRVESTRAAYDPTLRPIGQPEESPAAVASPPAPAPRVSPAEPPPKRRSLRPSKASEKPPPAKTAERPAPAKAAERPPPTKTAERPPPAPVSVTSRANDRAVAAVIVARSPGNDPIMQSGTVERPRPTADAPAPSSPTKSKTERFLEEAQKALIAGDAAAAANLYRLASQFADDGAMRGYAESGLNEARSMLADAYVKTGRTAEKEARWPEAVAAYGKALDHRPNDPALCERLANALREEGHDLVRATKVAELAVSRAPRRASFRKTLGRIHAEAGLRAKALEQLEGAFAVEPDTDTKRLIVALKKSSRG